MSHNIIHAIDASELIINERGRVYHLDLAPEQLATTVITVGSPDRVKEVSKYFDRITHKAQHREFITHMDIPRKVTPLFLAKLTHHS